MSEKQIIFEQVTLLIKVSNILIYGDLSINKSMNFPVSFRKKKKNEEIMLMYA